ncbi:MAG: thymidine phosphorylase [Bacteriovoracaceae bacterium]
MLKPNKHSAYELIDKKKNGVTLSDGEIKWLIQSLMNKTLPDYQMTAMLMAMFLKGMNVEETASLTDAMLFSGRTVELKEDNVIDKHSTGGIGDKTSFILAPIAAACGVLVPMMAGRSLGFTGGTIDKIEAVEGYRTDLSLEEFKVLLLKNGLVLMGQTEEIAPADKIIYGLRDVTATIDSIPLITASIMSKKLAEGANGVVMDIKCGNGAFMRNVAQAKKLGESIMRTAERFNKKATVLITDMNQPLGKMVGNSLEIIESVETLKGKGPKDLTDLSVELAAHMILLAGKAKDLKVAKQKATESIHNGTALEKFRLMIISQGGNPSFIDNYEVLPGATDVTEVICPKKSFIKSFETDQIGLALVDLGGGRKVKSDKIDFGVGFCFHKRVGDAVMKDESILTIYHHKNQKELVQSLVDKFLNQIIKFSSSKTKALPLVYSTMLLKKKTTTKVKPSKKKLTKKKITKKKG